MAEGRAFGDKDMDSATFQDALAALMEFMNKRLWQGDESARPLREQDPALSRVSRFMSHAMKKRISRTISRGTMRTISKAGLARGREQTGHISVRRMRTGCVSDQQSSTASVDVHSGGGKNKLQVAADAPCDISAPSVVVLRTTGGCFLVGESSSSNLPKEVADVPLDGLTAVAIAALAAHGFSIASQSSIGSTDELVYTLMRPAAAGAAQGTHGQDGATRKDVDNAPVLPSSRRIVDKKYELDVADDIVLEDTLTRRMADEVALGPSEEQVERSQTAQSSNNLHQRRRHTTPRHLRGSEGSATKDPS
jgi:hypothetical protein